MTEGERALTARLAMADLAEKALDAQYYIWDADTGVGVTVKADRRLSG